MSRSTVGLMLGDRFGVGPEVAAKALDTETPGARLVVLGDRRVFEYGRSLANANFRYRRLRSIDDLGDQDGVFLVDRPIDDLPVEPLGHLNEHAGREVLDQLSLLVDWATAGRIDGFVFAPLNKQAMRQAGLVGADELDHIIERAAFRGHAGEINVLGDLWTTRVTSHIPLRDVATSITTENVQAAIQLAAVSLRRASVSDPTVAVSGLNPHAGDGGLFGTEEIDIIGPAVAAAQNAGLRVTGPFPPDTVFIHASQNRTNAVVSMYHDQGQIALKLIGFARGVTLLAGLPFPVTTPAHGTAFDIAGSGTAKADGMQAALQLCIAMDKGPTAPAPRPA